jgi:uncharacterized membrane protein
MTTAILFAVLRLEGVRSSWAWLWALALLAGAAMLYATYRGIFQRSARRLTWWLMGLRAAGLLLLVLMLAKPTWTREREEVEPGRVAIVLDTSRSMSLPDASGASRYARATAAIEQLRTALAGDRSGPALKVELFDITGAPLTSVPKEPTDDSTDLTRALKRVTARLRSRPLAGVVLISDGVDNTGRPSFRDWEDTSATIHAIGFKQGADIDLSVREPQVPRRVLAHNALTIEVPVAKVGRPPAKGVKVTLRRGKEVLATKTVDMPAGDSEQLVPLTIKPEQPGTFELTAEVAGMTGEKDLSNNAVNFPLEVVADPIRVLYLEGFLRYEAKFLKERLEDDPDVSLATMVRLDNPEIAKGRRVKVTDEELKKIDVVILGDMEGNFLDRSEHQALVRWLDGKNHSLLVLGGYRSFGPAGLRTTPLADVLPVVFAPPEATQSETAFSLRLTDKGQAHPIFTVSADRVVNTKLWHEAPPLDGMSLVQRAKPAATILAVNPKVQLEGRPAPAVIVQNAGGGGQVMVLTLDTTWQWSRLPRILGQADNLYSRFWSQTVRWLAGRPLEDRRPLLSLSTQRPLFDAGSKVRLRVTRNPRPGTDLSGTETTVEVIDPKGKAVPGLVTRFGSADPNVGTVDFYPTEAGQYEVGATLKSAGKVLANVSGEFRVRGADLELSDTSTKPQNLKDLAGETGGTSVDIEDADLLSKKINRVERRQARVLRSEYWDSPVLFAAFLLAVAGEWFLRRVNHLV